VIANLRDDCKKIRQSFSIKLKSQDGQLATRQQPRRPRRASLAPGTSPILKKSLDYPAADREV
jgi:hypothetical protein